MTTEAELWKARYQTLAAAVSSVCGVAHVTGTTMTGQECFNLITEAVKAVEDGGKLDTERPTEDEGPEGEGEGPAFAADGV